MRTIENTSLVLLAAAVIFVGLVTAAFLFERYTADIPPVAKVTTFSFERTVREANNLEGLKQMCLRLAENEDDARKAGVMLLDRFNAMTREIAVMLITAFTLFACGVAYIYIAARRLRLAGIP
jgi:hypothetical protein